MNSNYRSLKKRISILFMLGLMLLTLPAAAATDTGLEENNAPTVEDLAYTTYRNVTLSGNLQAVDSEGDMLEYRLSREPKKGALEILEDGSFTYTPVNDEKGRDTFTYVAVDSLGNISEEATVTIQIEKQSTDVSYSDMAGHLSEYAALMLAEKDIFVGEKLGDHYFFHPDQTVSRGDFLAMCMRLAGAELITDISKTGFADDEAISDWLKPYVTTAVMNGTVQGYRSENGGVVFSADAPICLAEAAVMLNNTLGLYDISTSGSVFDNNIVPAWAHQAAANLTAYNIISTDFSSTYGRTLTRSATADMLHRAMTLLDGDETSLLRWAY